MEYEMVDQVISMLARFEIDGEAAVLGKWIHWQLAEVVRIMTAFSMKF